MLLRILLLLFLGMVTAWPQSVPVPDTPAGHTLQAWLDAFNSGDRARMQAYITKYEPTSSVDQTAAFREQTGGFELLGVDKSERLHIEFRVKEKASPTNAVGKIDVKDADPAQVVSFSLLAIPPGMTAADMTMKVDALIHGRVIDGAIAALNESYVYPGTAKKMEEALRARQKKGEYDSVTDAEAFAKLLTDHLQQVSHDKHLHVNFVPMVLPKDEAKPDPDDEARIAASLWFRSAEGALRTIDGYEAMHLIRKGPIRWLPKGDVVGQHRFIHTLFGIAV
jgi:hypothetical protein